MLILPEILMIIFEWIIFISDLTVLCVDQVVAAASEGPVHSVTRLTAGTLLYSLIETLLFEEIYISSITGI